MIELSHMFTCHDVSHCVETVKLFSNFTHFVRSK